MTPTRQGSIRLFRFAGIDLYLHWSWFIVAAYELSNRRDQYTSFTWNALEYFALFGIVLMHEFGHSLACRQVGGKADQIVLWPLGGVAYVDPPQRPGATLWSIAAGPMVNVVMMVVLAWVLKLSAAMGWPRTNPDVDSFLIAVYYINNALLLFNLLPVYPLDGGQIVRSLLWYVAGRARSLMIASIMGFIGIGILLALAVWLHLVKGSGSIWIPILAVFMLLNCWRGLLHARTLAKADQASRHDGFACPGCQTAPPQGAFWMCGQCRKTFDTFDTHATCPNCGAQYPETRCMECGKIFPLHDWMRPAFGSAPPIRTNPEPPVG